MYNIVNQRVLNSTTGEIEVHAPLIAKKIQPGQFVILRLSKWGERVPFTVARVDVEKGTITIIFQIVGATTKKMGELRTGDAIQDVAGPLGRATELEGLKKVVVIGGGSGCAIAYPIANKLYKMGAAVHSIAGFRSKELVIMETEFQTISADYTLMTDDGSAGRRGLVTETLEEKLKAGVQYDAAIAVGPLPMMKFVSLLTKRYQLKTIVSMNAMMIDGTGMCGCCRLMVNGQMKFACVDGPDFDGHLVDFDETIQRMNMYTEQERHAYEKTCNLLQKQEGF